MSTSRIQAIYGGSGPANRPAPPRSRTTPSHRRSIRSAPAHPSLAVRRQATRSASRQVGVALARNLHQTSARIRSTPNGLEVSHTEFFTAAKTTTLNVDQVDAWTIQPGWSSMFPWLSGIASRFERYNLQRLAFDYRPRVPTSTVGTIVLSIDPDPDDSIPDATDGGRQALLSHAGAAETSVWNSLHIEYPRAQLAELGHRFVCSDDTTPGPGAIEPRTTHAGLLNVGFFGNSPAQTYGDLSVTYTVRFWNPQLNWVAGVSPTEAKKGSATFTATTGSGMTWGAGAQVFATAAGTVATAIEGLADLTTKAELVHNVTGLGFQLYKTLVADPADGVEPMVVDYSPSSYTGDVTVSFRLFKSGETALPYGWAISAGCYIPPSGALRPLTSVRCQAVPTTAANTWVLNFTYRGQIQSSEIQRVTLANLPGWGVNYTDGTLVVLFDGVLAFNGEPTVNIPSVHLDPMTTTQQVELERRIQRARSRSMRFYPSPKGKERDDDRPCRH